MFVRVVEVPAAELEFGAKEEQYGLVAGDEFA
jgi:hypothetical protein